MGLDIRCKIVYGIPIEIIDVNEQVVKYNETTGEPYGAIVKTKGYATKSGVAIAIDDTELWDGTIIHHVDYENRDGWYLGLLVAETCSHRFGLPHMEVPALTESVIARTDDLLHSKGVRGMMPALYCLAVLSY